MEKIILTNMCLIENKQTDEVVVIHRIKDWTGIAFPGGHVENGEPIVPSVIREIKEETNLDIYNVELCGIRDWYNPDDNERNIVFMFKTASFSGKLKEDNVEGKVEWRKLDSIKPEEYASGLDKEMSIFFDKDTNEYFSSKDIVSGQWDLKKF